MILGTDFIRYHGSDINCSQELGFRPSIHSPWVPTSRAPGLRDWEAQRAQEEEAAWDTAASDNAEPPICAVSAVAIPAVQDTTDVSEHRLAPLPAATWEDDGSRHWQLRPVRAYTFEPGVSQIIEAYVKRPQPQQRLLVVVKPAENFNPEAHATLAIMRGVQWWEPGLPLACSKANTTRAPMTLPQRRVVAKLVELNSRDGNVFAHFWNRCPSRRHSPHAQLWFKLLS